MGSNTKSWSNDLDDLGSHLGQNLHLVSVLYIDYNSWHFLNLWLFLYWLYKTICHIWPIWLPLDTMWLWVKSYISNGIFLYKTIYKTIWLWVKIAYPNHSMVLNMNPQISGPVGLILNKIHMKFDRSLTTCGIGLINSFTKFTIMVYEFIIPVIFKYH